MTLWRDTCVKFCMCRGGGGIMKMEMKNLVNLGEGLKS